MSAKLARLSSGAILGALAGLLWSCTANQQPSRLETTLANMAKDVVIPLEAANRKNPFPASQEVLEQMAAALSAVLCALPGDGRSWADEPGARDVSARHGPHFTPRPELDRRRAFLDYSKRRVPDGNAVLEVQHFGNRYLEAGTLYP